LPKLGKRKRGKKNPHGMTRALILLYILEKGIAPTSEIRDYFKTKDKKLNIKSKSPIYNQIAKLEESGFIEAVGKVDRGYEKSYRAKEGFDNLKSIFNFLKEYSLEGELLKTDYYNRVITDEGFNAKILINTFKELYLRLVDEVQNNQDDREETLIEIEKASKDFPIIEGKSALDYAIGNFDRRDSYQKGDQNDAYVKRRKLIIDTLTNNSVDQLYALLLGVIDSVKHDKNALSIDVVKSVISKFIPDDEKENVITILKVSPSANDYLLNIGKFSPIDFFGILVTFFLYTQQREGERTSVESPIIRILNSALIMDYANGEAITQDQTPSNQLAIFKQLFLQGIKEDKV